MVDSPTAGARAVSPDRHPGHSVRGWRPVRWARARMARRVGPHRERQDEDGGPAEAGTRGNRSGPPYVPLRPRGEAGRPAPETSGTTVADLGQGQQRDGRGSEAPVLGETLGHHAGGTEREQPVLDGFRETVGTVSAVREDAGHTWQESPGLLLND
ncbi:hypothetical protein BU198_33535 [Streptomyces sp. CBMA156]|nr:hypothetical protein [Streptomyces sp. CBMA156]